jgi:hypothetical protein
MVRPSIPIRASTTPPVTSGQGVEASTGPELTSTVAEDIWNQAIAT